MSLNLAYVMVVSDGYETYGVCGFTNAQKAHEVATLRLAELTRYTGDKLCVHVDDNGNHVLSLRYVNGGYCERWYPPITEYLAER